MSNDFVIAKVYPGVQNALIKNLMQQMKISDPNEVCRRINSGEWIVSELERAWREKDGVISFSVTSNNRTGEDWIKCLDVSDYAKSILRSPDFKPTDGVPTEVAVLKGTLFADNDRITKNIRAEADKRGLSKPNAEVACLIREKFTNEEIKAMGLWWVVIMHEPIKDSDGDPGLLGVDRRDVGWLGASYDSPDYGWDRESGFAFAVS